MDSKIAHLGFIQAVVARMGKNAFLLKGWSVTLVAAIFALAPKDADKGFLFLAYLPIFMFWCLDAYYLSQERRFRHLYLEVSEDRIPSDKFTLDTSFSNACNNSFYFCLFSRTTVVFHGLLSVIVLTATIYLRHS